MDRVGALPPDTFGRKVSKQKGLGSDLWKSEPKPFSELNTKPGC